jgi:hypothetical protein
MRQIRTSITRAVQAELYERRLTRFAEREVGKTGGALPPQDFARLVSRELLRLSVTAFAMFNRGPPVGDRSRTRR